MNARSHAWASEHVNELRRAILLGAAFVGLVGCNLAYSPDPLPPRDENDVADTALLDDVDQDPVDDVDDTTDVPVAEPNACGGQTALRFEGAERDVLDACGDCGGGYLVCNGPDQLVCVGAAPTNACGGCAILEGDPGGECGACGGGHLVCDGGGLRCDEPFLRNRCGGCEVLAGAPGSLCLDDGHEGTWVCDSADEVICDAEANNPCGGTNAQLLFGDAPAGLNDICEPPCGEPGVLVCETEETLRCSGDGGELNACGGCGALAGAPGQSCGGCEGLFACSDDNTYVTCRALPPNPCGGCAALDELGEACGDDGVWICDGEDALACSVASSTDELNACGGTGALDAEPGERCGTCGTGTTLCDGPNRMKCDGDLGDAVLNACGGCEPLDGLPSEPCGACGDGRWSCDGEEGVVCDGGVDVPSLMLWHDVDGDGFGAGEGEARCDREVGWAERDGDCNDVDPSVHPEARERCDGLDNDCDEATADGVADSRAGEACDGDDADLCAFGETACVDGAIACTDTAVVLVPPCGDDPPNACGGCEALSATPGEACTTACGDGVWQCARSGAVSCTAPEPNACGGCGTLAGELGASCVTSCGMGSLACEGTALACSAPLANPCGGCGALAHTPGSACATGCGDGAWVCREGNVVCTAPALNACGGCAPLGLELGGACGEGGCGEVVCAGTDALRCNEEGC